MKEKKRKFYGNRHVKVEELPDSEASKEEKIAETSTSSLTTASDEVTSSSASEFRSLPASKRKLDCDLSSVDEENCTDGFRIIDISILMSIFNTFICPKCKSGHIVMKEDITAKMGLVTQLSLECSAKMCSYSMNFYTSSRVNNKSKAFEGNRRAV